jgi:NAD(P) transhydrogenase subunit alpha
MAMRIGVPKETADGERRVALVPDAVAALVKSSLAVTIEPGAGEAAYFRDADYQQAGAQVGADAWTADIVLKVQKPTAAEVGRLRPGAVLIGLLQPASSGELLEQLAARNVTALALELVPRISRAQKMDALSSQASVAGYKAALFAAERLSKYFPMLMTAAGTIPPAKVLVLGAGVAGLQAIATARRLGANVWGYDVRPVVKEQVESLGAKFLEFQLATKETEDKGGYAKELSAEDKARQQAWLAEKTKEFDVVITTALIPGKPAPKLITRATVEGMRPGSVIVDLAAEAGGNCDVTQPGRDVNHQGVWVLGPLNVPSTMPTHASQLYARNVSELARLILKEGKLNLDFTDEIIQAVCVTHAGKVLRS